MLGLYLAIMYMSVGIFIAISVYVFDKHAHDEDLLYIPKPLLFVIEVLTFPIAIIYYIKKGYDQYKKRR